MRKRSLDLTILLLILGAGGCSLLRPEPPAERNAAVRLDHGLAALEAGRYGVAFDELAWVYSHCPGRATGARALVALTALELDPRNPASRPDVATDLLARIIREPAPPAWVRPLAESAYLMALALGAPPAPGSAMSADTVVGDTLRVGETRTAGAAPSPAPSREGVWATVEEPVHGCGEPVPAEGWVARRLPVLPGPSMVALLRESETERSRLAAQGDSLTQRLSAISQKLEETERELERVRRALKP